MFVLLAPSQNAGAKFRSTVSYVSPWAQQRGVYIQRGTQECSPCRWACLCLSPPCQDEPEARSAPLPLRLYPVFPVKEIWASRAEEHWGVPAAAAGLRLRRQGLLLHTCPTRQVRPRGLSAAHGFATWEQEPPAREHPPLDSCIPREAAFGEPEDTNEDCGK